MQNLDVNGTYGHEQYQPTGQHISSPETATTGPASLSTFTHGTVNRGYAPSANEAGKAALAASSPSALTGHTVDEHHGQQGEGYTEDEEMQQAMEQSRRAMYAPSQAGASTSYAYPSYPAGQSAYAPVAPGWQSHLAAPNSYARYGTAPLEQDLTAITATSQASFLSDIVIQATPGLVERYDPRYKVERSWKFKPGEVLFPEPRGQVRGLAEPSDIKTWRTDRGSQLVYLGFRRFIIVWVDESHHSTCVPILTYERQGCKKPGVKPQKHGMIYEGLQPPRPLRDEPQLGYEPVGVEIYAEQERLVTESRVNYSKLVSIEHNVKVFFIGTIPHDHFHGVVIPAVWDCIDKKRPNPAQQHSDGRPSGHRHPSGRRHRR
ncbi:hypothetical protein GGR56DRAFT_108646 [Xylariaceae sp. FL0804]|nr:hypothetical protein GGR56DRAFT_108646 [Xylariaceae sp. FL0804]